MIFLNFSNVDIQFIEKKLTWRCYIIKEALFITYKENLSIKKIC